MARLNGFTKQQLLDIYNTMVLARELDNRMLTLIKQGKGFLIEMQARAYSKRVRNGLLQEHTRYQIYCKI